MEGVFHGKASFTALSVSFPVEKTFLVLVGVGGVTGAKFVVVFATKTKLSSLDEACLVLALGRNVLLRFERSRGGF